jgi:predicted phosphodiesterase
VLIASVSDLHTDHPENRDAVVKLALEIHRNSADLVIVAGDVSHHDDRIRRALTAFREVAGTVAYVPGNHDLWYDVPHAAVRGDLNTWGRYRTELRALAEDCGAHYLPASPLVVDGVALVGSCGWYDYSLAPDWLRGTVTEDALASKQYGQLQWSDARLIAFRDAAGALMKDPEVARTMEQELKAHLEAVDAREDVRHVVAVTHHQPFREVVHRTGTLPWEFFTAFMGSAGLGEVIRAGRKVRAAVYGHSHVPDDRQLEGLRVFGTPLGYPRERRGLSEEQMLATRIGWIRL